MRNRQAPAVTRPTCYTPYLSLTGAVVAHPLPVLVHLAHEHLPCPEVKAAQVHGASQIASQLWLAPEFLPAWADLEEGAFRKTGVGGEKERE